MKNFFSTAIIATAFALLVPNNGAEAVGTFAAPSARPASLAGASVPQAGVSRQAVAGMGDNGTDEPDPSYAWIMGLGFLGFVATRRLRGN